jgi:hypothetical protein
MFGLRGRQIIILLIIAALVFAAIQYVPAYLSAFQFNDYIRQEVKFAFSSRKTLDALRTDVLRKAQELAIPIMPRDLRIMRHGPSFRLELDYRLPIDLKVYRHDLSFHVSESGEVFENAAN